MSVPADAVCLPRHGMCHGGVHSYTRTEKGPMTKTKILPGPEVLIIGKGWRVIRQLDNTITLNIEKPIDIAVTDSTFVVTMPEDFLYRMSQYRRNSI